MTNHKIVARFNFEAQAVESAAARTEAFGVQHVAKHDARTDTYVVEQTTGRCSQHPAYDADYCPVCGTARVIGS